MTQYATYDKDGYFNGVVEADEQPKNSSPFMPIESPPGYRPWFDGIGWVQQPVLNDATVDLQRAKEVALGLLSKATMEDPDVDRYPTAERESFDAQYAEALAVLNGQGIGPYVLAIADATDEDPSDLAKSIVKRHEAYRERHAAFVAKLQVLRKRITNATTHTDLPSHADLRKVGVR